MSRDIFVPTSTRLGKYFQIKLILSNKDYFFHRFNMFFSKKLRDIISFNFGTEKIEFEKTLIKNNKIKFYETV